MDISTLLSTRFYDVSTSLEEVAHDANLMYGLGERAVWRPRIYLALLLLFPFPVLAFVIATVNGTSESEMPFVLGIPLMLMGALEVNFIMRFFLWVGARFQPRRYQLPVTLLRALNLDRSAPVRVRCALDMMKATDPIKVAGRLASGVAFDFELAHHSYRKDRTITWFFTSSVTLTSAPGSFPRVESLGPAIAQHIRLPGGITPDFVGNAPGALTVRSKIPVEWHVGGGTMNNAVLFAAAMIESMHGLLLPGFQVVDHQRAAAQPDLHAAFEVKAAKPAWPMLALGAALLPLALVLGAVGFHNHTQYESLRDQQSAVYSQLMRAQDRAERPYDAGPQGQPMSVYEARYAAYQRDREAAQHERYALSDRNIELGMRAQPYDTTAKRCFLIAPVALLGGLVALVVGLLRLRRR